ncbi:MAG: methyltransferase domain-containing protein [Bacteroidales bacterium]|nr:methyltransferase domain-containing protein [Bacteroidales bacterium]
MTYIHGYTKRETQRLLEQALILEDLLHSDTVFKDGENVLEAGCGVGGQTQILCRRNPGAEFTCIDISAASLEQAERMSRETGIRNANFQQADILSLPFNAASFDHVFVCFVLEHLPDPDSVLSNLVNLLKPGGTLTVIEGDHGSGFWTPETHESRKAWGGLVRSQFELGHDPDIGRRLYPLLRKTGLEVRYVEPRWVYADQSTPELLDGVINQIIAPMVYSAENQVLEYGLMEESDWQKGLDDIRNVARHPDGTFFYTWFKGIGRAGKVDGSHN